LAFEIFATRAAAMPIAGSVTAVAMHAAHATDAVEVEIFAHTVVPTSLDREPFTRLSGRVHRPLKINLP